MRSTKAATSLREGFWSSMAMGSMVSFLAAAARRTTCRAQDATQRRKALAYPDYQRPAVWGNVRGVTMRKPRCRNDDGARYPVSSNAAERRALRYTTVITTRNGAKAGIVYRRSGMKNVVAAMASSTTMPAMVGTG